MYGNAFNAYGGDFGAKDPVKECGKARQDAAKWSAKVASNSTPRSRRRRDETAAARAHWCPLATQQMVEQQVALQAGIIPDYVPPPVPEGAGETNLGLPIAIGVGVLILAGAAALAMRSKK